MLEDSLLLVTLQDKCVHDVVYKWSNTHRGPIERVVLMARTLPCMEIGRFEHQCQMDLNVQRVYQLNRCILFLYIQDVAKTLIPSKFWIVQGVGMLRIVTGSIPRTEDTTKISRHETRFAIGRCALLAFWAYLTYWGDKYIKISADDIKRLLLR